MMMTRLTTIARTGRRMKMSVNFMARLSGSRGGARAAASACTSLSTTTGEPLRSLNAPALTTSCPAVTPSTIATKSPRAAPRRTNCWRAILTGLPSGVVAMPGASGLLVLDDEDRVAVRRVDDAPSPGR